MNGPKIYFTIPIFGGIPITQTIVSSFVVMVCLCVAGILLGRNLQKRPSRRQVLVEKGVSMLYGMVEDTMGKHNAYWTPYIGALFLSSICGSYIGMTGIFRSATADLSTTVTWALMTSFLCWGCSIKANGFLGWLKGFTKPIVVMTPMNLVSEIAQPISMAFRHFGNIAGGSVLTSLVYSALATVSAALLGLVGKNIVVSAVVLVIGIALLVSGLREKKMARKIFGVVFIATGILALLGLSGVPYLEVGIPGILSLYFDVFSGGVQALVFSLLTMVYVGNACPPPEEA
ncbi:F0F1 ATP synthase subunit A [Gemmiger formicilis]|uniref:FoF1 ATP synthase subunit A n=1 Tax=Gemmiger formicilis TaxID=745368 RepID=UPI0019564957|nr:FoF1 ATP synthase subunit a [Gemmiger formicilis]MBM6898163.1 F0F1 ATP synthase subunit A [Gemmiger formicilis]